MSKEETSSSLRLLVRTSVFIFFMVVLSKLFSYLYKFVVAKNFGPEIYGTFSLAMIVLGIFTSLAMLGFPEGITRFVAYYKGKRQEGKTKYTLKFSLGILLLCSFIAALILYWTSGIISLDIFKNEKLVVFLKILSISLPFSVIFSIVTSYLRGVGRVGSYSMLINVVQNGLKLGVLLALIIFGIGEKSVVMSHTISMVLLIIIAYIIARKGLIDLFRKKDIGFVERKSVEKDLFNYSWPLIFVGLLYSVFYWTDSLVLGYMMDSATVGLYNSAVTLTSLFAIAQDLFIQLFFPLLSTKYAEKKINVVRDITKQVMKWVFLINILVFAALILFPGVMIKLFFGAEFLAAQGTLQILAFGALLSGFLGLFITLLSIGGKTRLILYNYIAFTIMNLVLDVILVKMYGMNGAAIATTITWISFTIAVLFQIKKNYGFFPIKNDILKIIAVAGILVLIAYVVQDYVVPTLLNIGIFGAIFLAVYIFSLWVTRCFDEQDWEIVNSVKEKIGNYRK